MLELSFLSSRFVNVFLIKDRKSVTSNINLLLLHYYSGSVDYLL